MHFHRFLKHLSNGFLNERWRFHSRSAPWNRHGKRRPQRQSTNKTTKIPKWCNAFYCGSISIDCACRGEKQCRRKRTRLLIFNFLIKKKNKLLECANNRLLNLGRRRINWNQSLWETSHAQTTHIHPSRATPFLHSPQRSHDCMFLNLTHNRRDFFTRINISFVHLNVTRTAYEWTRPWCVQLERVFTGNVANRRF